MVRIQVQLRTTQHREIKRRAKRLGVSVSELVRRCLDAQLTANNDDGVRERVRRALAVVGKYADTTGVTDVAREHDRYLAEAYER